MKEVEKVLKALADKNRLRILKLLEHRKMCVCELAFVLEIKQPSVSRHLTKLKSAGFISCEQDGFWTNYFLTQNGDSYSAELIKNVSNWLGDDDLVLSDFKKAAQADRAKLCCR